MAPINNIPAVISNNNSYQKREPDLETDREIDWDRKKDRDSDPNLDKDRDREPDRDSN